MYVCVSVSLCVIIGVRVCVCVCWVCVPEIHSSGTNKKEWRGRDSAIKERASQVRMWKWVLIAFFQIPSPFILSPFCCNIHSHEHFEKHSNIIFQIHILNHDIMLQCSDAAWEVVFLIFPYDLSIDTQLGSFWSSHNSFLACLNSSQLRLVFIHACGIM